MRDVINGVSRDVEGARNCPRAEAERWHAPCLGHFMFIQAGIALCAATRMVRRGALVSWCGPHQPASTSLTQPICTYSVQLVWPGCCGSLILLSPPQFIRLALVVAHFFSPSKAKERRNFEFVGHTLVREA